MNSANAFRFAHDSPGLIEDENSCNKIRARIVLLQKTPISKGEAHEARTRSMEKSLHG